MIKAWFRTGALFSLALLLFLPVKVYADYDVEMAYSLGMGSRVDNLDWSIAGNLYSTGPYVNVLSELKWSDLEISQFKADGRFLVGKDQKFVLLKVMLDYGWILSGDNRDSDYAGNNRTLEFSRSSNSANNGNVSDASLGLGYQFRLVSDRIRITPLMGYSSSRQNLRMTNGYQTVSRPDLYSKVSPLGPFYGLDSTYETQWKGPWIGLELSLQASEKIALFGSFEYHWADYYAKANWNLRDDLAHPISFEHDADGTGIVASAGGAYVFNERWSLKIYLDMQQWSTDPGLDRVFGADGGYVETLLNEVNWSSFAAGLELTYTFKGISRSRRAVYY